MSTHSEKLDEPVIEAAGGLLWRETAGADQIAIIHRERYDDWSLPKGKREPGESWQDTALREVFEETGCQVELVSFAGGTTYQVNGVAKVVLFWHMRLVSEDELQVNTEVDALQWLDLAEALQVLDYPGERALVAHALITGPGG